MKSPASLICAVVMLAGCIEGAPVDVDPSPETDLTAEFDTLAFRTAHSLADAALATVPAHDVGTILQVNVERLEVLGWMLPATEHAATDGFQALLVEASSALNATAHLLSYEVLTNVSAAAFANRVGVALVGAQGEEAPAGRSLAPAAAEVAAVRKDLDEALRASLDVESVTRDAEGLRVTFASTPPVPRCCSWTVEACSEGCVRSNPSLYGLANVTASADRAGRTLVIAGAFPADEVLEVRVRSFITKTALVDRVVLADASSATDALGDVAADEGPPAG